MAFRRWRMRHPRLWPAAHASAVGQGQLPSVHSAEEIAAGRGLRQRRSIVGTCTIDVMRCAGIAGSGSLDRASRRLASEKLFARKQMDM